MLNSPSNHGHSLGLSVGATNLAGTLDGHTAVIRPAELTLHGQRLTGFVEASAIRCRWSRLTARSIGPKTCSPTRSARWPRGHRRHAGLGRRRHRARAHWRASVVDTLRRNLRGRPPVVSDATAALTALRANPGLPTHGVIALCDFGGSGTSITLANAARDFRGSARPCAFPTSPVTTSIRRC